MVTPERKSQGMTEISYLFTGDIECLEKIVEMFQSGKVTVQSNQQSKTQKSSGH